MINIASYIDHTILKPTATRLDIDKIYKEAVMYGFAAVCIPPPYITYVKGSAGVKIATVIGFPFGYSALGAKMVETEQAVRDGAGEVDIVINLTALKNGNWRFLEEEMKLITETAREEQPDMVVKVIIESGILTDEEIIRCCEIYAPIGVDFLKTSTGYAEKGASVHAVQLMRSHLPSSVKIKASGGIRTYDFAMELIAAGADRLGCSASVEIVKGASSAKEAGTAQPGSGY